MSEEEERCRDRDVRKWNNIYLSRNGTLLHWRFTTYTNYRANLYALGERFVTDGPCLSRKETGPGLLDAGGCSLARFTISGGRLQGR